MLTAFYDLNYAPASYDILHFLICAQAAAKGEPFHVVIVPGTHRGFKPADHKPIERAEKQWRVDHVLVPACRLAGASVTVAPTRAFAAQFKGDPVFPIAYRVDYPRPWYTLGLCLEAIAAGATPRFAPSERAKAHVARMLDGKKRVVTITLRQTHTPTRNSDLWAWRSFAKTIREDGYWPVIIPDTERMTDRWWHRDDPLSVAEDPLIEHCPLAALDLDIRAALYDAATMNMASSGGPFMLNVFLNRPYIFFLEVDGPKTLDADGGAHWRPTTAYMTQLGWPPGSQWPGAGPLSRTIWKKETYSDIVNAFYATLAEDKAA